MSPEQDRGENATFERHGLASLSRAVLRAPLTARTWMAVLHLAAGLPVGLLGFFVLGVLCVLTMSLSLSIVLAVLAVVAQAALLACVRACSTIQRSRFTALLGVDIPFTRRPVAGGWFGRVMSEARRESTWRQLCYHLIAPLIGGVGFAATAVTAAAALTFTTAPLWAWFAESGFGWHLGEPLTLLGLTAGGAAALFAAPWVARAAVAIDVSAAMALLGSAREKELVESRAGLLAAIEAERRRIERDLHDGTQQRLTAMAVKLAIAGQTLTDLPEPALRAINEAQEEATQALAELRDLIRGLHPAVLDDLGLNAALSGVVGRSPIPVELTVDLPGRLPPPIESIAYFVVSEALTNVSKHSGADRVEVAVNKHGDWLHVRIADNGRGGAVVGTGSGLRGLGQRVASADGAFAIDSPAGAGTTIKVDLPCEVSY
ncbi:histidine kinase [Streptosporangium sp. NPDC020072]|uniref:sensor histidine kinase n=1 Tax=unclassified Streptosporangium TaxID=2632669 RepID=UPI00343F5ECE